MRPVASDFPSEGTRFHQSRQSRPEHLVCQTETGVVADGVHTTVGSKCISHFTQPWSQRWDNHSLIVVLLLFSIAMSRGS
jgi:hypothetical protein